MWKKIYQINILYALHTIQIRCNKLYTGPWILPRLLTGCNSDDIGAHRGVEVGGISATSESTEESPIPPRKGIDLEITWMI